MNIKDYRYPIKDKDFIQSKLQEIIKISYRRSVISKWDNALKFGLVASSILLFFLIFDFKVFIELAIGSVFIIFIGLSVFIFSQKRLNDRLNNEYMEAYHFLLKKGYQAPPVFHHDPLNMDPSRLINLLPINENGGKIEIDLNPFDESSYR